MQLHVEQEVDGAVEALFDVISRPALRPQWQSSLRSVQLLTPEPLGVGTRWREVTVGKLSFELQISRFEPHVCWAEQGGNRWAEIILTVNFSGATSLPSRARTQLTVDVALTLHGPARLALPILALSLPAALRADLRRAAALAQSVCNR